MMLTYEFGSLHELLELVNAWVVSMMTTMGYAGLGLVMFVENIFPPLPSEVILPLAGSLTASGHFTLAGITLVGMAGSVAGAWVFYGIGYWLDEKRVRNLIQRYGRWLLLSTDDLDRAMQWFDRYGHWVVFFGRMVPVVRSLISVPAGLSKMHWAKFTLFTAMGTACWTFVLAYAGNLLGQNWGLVEEFISRYQLVVFAVVGAGLLWFVYQKMMVRLAVKKTPSR